MDSWDCRRYSNLSYCYSWEVEHIKNEKIRLIDYEILQNDIIEFNDVETSAKQSLASALGYQERYATVENELDVCFLIFYLDVFLALFFILYYLFFNIRSYH